jgi:hypothetical protein
MDVKAIRIPKRKDPAQHEAARGYIEFAEANKILNPAAGVKFRRAVVPPN